MWYIILSILSFLLGVVLTIFYFYIEKKNYQAKFEKEQNENSIKRTKIGYKFYDEEK